MAINNILSGMCSNTFKLKNYASRSMLVNTDKIRVNRSNWLLLLRLLLVLRFVLFSLVVILRGDLLYVFPCVILFMYFSVLLVLRLPHLGKRELILVLFVRLFGLCLFSFVGFPFLLGSGKGYGLWLWHSLDFSLTFFALLCDFMSVKPDSVLLEDCVQWLLPDFDIPIFLSFTVVLIFILYWIQCIYVQMKAHAISSVDITRRHFLRRLNY